MGPLRGPPGTDEVVVAARATWTLLGASESGYQ
jgi:hypothetical protein